MNNFLMEMMHYDNVSFKFNPQLTYSVDSSSWFKPHGFWLSEGSAWKEWCLCEEFKIDSLAREFKVLVDGSRILKILSPSDVYQLDSHYGNHLSKQNLSITRIFGDIGQ